MAVGQRSPLAYLEGPLLKLKRPKWLFADLFCTEPFHNDVRRVMYPVKNQRRSLLPSGRKVEAVQLTMTKNPPASIYGCQLSMHFGEPPAGKEHKVTYNLSSRSRKIKLAVDDFMIHRSNTSQLQMLVSHGA